jgi:hypothetical protein
LLRDVVAGGVPWGKLRVVFSYSHVVEKFRLFWVLLCLHRFSVANHNLHLPDLSAAAPTTIAPTESSIPRLGERSRRDRMGGSYV